MSEGFDELVAKLSRYPSGYLYDAARRLGLGGATERVKPLRPGWRLGGPVLTVKYGPNRGVKTGGHSIYSVLAEAAPGAILVIEYGLDRWVMGENMMHAVIQAGLAGVLLDGCVRDAEEIRTMDLPVFCRGAAIRGYAPEHELSDVGVPVVCGGAHVRPGDYVFGDDDGAIVVPGDQLVAVAYQAEDIAEVEEEQARAIAERRPLEELKKILARKKQRRA